MVNQSKWSAQITWLFVAINSSEIQHTASFPQTLLQYKRIWLKFHYAYGTGIQQRWNNHVSPPQHRRRQHGHIPVHLGIRGRGTSRWEIFPFSRKNLMIVADLFGRHCCCLFWFVGDVFLHSAWLHGWMHSKNDAIGSLECDLKKRHLPKPPSLSVMTQLRIVWESFWHNAVLLHLRKCHGHQNSDLLFLPPNLMQCSWNFYRSLIPVVLKIKQLM